MYRLAEINDGKASINKFSSKEFQGREIKSVENMIFWFIWGEWTFDIRSIRKYYGRKPVKNIDLKDGIHPCTRFRKQMNEIITLVGDDNFEEVLKKAREIHESTQNSVS